MQHPERLDNSLIEDYAENFFGYGALSGKYWFVGMEEGGGDTFREVDARMRSWRERGRRELEDVCEFSATVGLHQWFGPKARLQRTWSRYIRVICGMEGISADREWIRRYQAESLGRFEGESSLMNLLPFPSRSLKHWHYANLSELPHLGSRNACMDHYAEKRAKRLRSRILKERPRLVLFASMDARYRKWWQTIADVEFKPRSFAGKAFDFGIMGSTAFVVTQHPAVRSMSNEFFQTVGKYVAERVR